MSRPIRRNYVMSAQGSADVDRLSADTVRVDVETPPHLHVGHYSAESSDSLFGTVWCYSLPCASLTSGKIHPSAFNGGHPWVELEPGDMVCCRRAQL